jgi:DNA-binding NarL/FixJ family response regulator
MSTHPNLRILVLTGYESEARELQLGTLLAGAAGCLSKEHAAHTYLAAIQVLIQGQVIYQYATITSALRVNETIDSSPSIPSISTVSAPLPALNHGLDDLTAREIEILQLVAKGKGNPEIALILNITENTVMKHVSHIISKLNVRNRMEAGLVYLRSI